MKDFNYSAPETAKEAVALPGKLNDKGKIFCGGQSLLCWY